MRVGLLLLAACAAGCSSTSTSPTTGGNGLGAVAFSITFNGGQACSAVGATQLTVAIGGQTQNISCAPTGATSATVSGLSPGIQTYSVTALASNNGTVATASGSVTVIGDHTVDDAVDVQVAATTGTVTFNWTFGTSNLNCNAAGVDQVRVAINGAAPVVYPCFGFSDNGLPGASLSGLPVGTPSSFDIAGYTPVYDFSTGAKTEVEAYAASGTVTATAGEISEAVQLSAFGTPAMSNIVLLWSFGGQTCTAAGVSTVQLMVTDPSNSANDVNMAVDCPFSGTDGAEVQNFSAGTYGYAITATGSSGTTYAASGSVLVNGYDSPEIHIDAQIQTTSTAAGTAALDFVFGPSAQSCAQAGLDHVHLFLTDASGAVVSGSDVTPACGALPIQISGLTAPATYYVSAQGLAGTAANFMLSQYQIDVYPGSTSTYTIDVPANL